MFNEVLHTVTIVALLLIIPLSCTLIESAIKRYKGKLLLYTISKWFIFWSLGVRLFTAGLMQVLNPAYTAGLLQVDSQNYIMIQELGCANLGLGLTGILSLFLPRFRKPAALAIGIFIAGASVIHLLRLSVLNTGEFLSLAGDLLICAVAVFTLLLADGSSNKSAPVLI